MEILTSMDVEASPSADIARCIAEVLRTLENDGHGVKSVVPITEDGATVMILFIGERAD